jgi:hypothetical protein
MREKRHGNAGPLRGEREGAVHTPFAKRVVANSATENRILRLSIKMSERIKINTKLSYSQ